MDNIPGVLTNIPGTMEEAMQGGAQNKQCAQHAAHDAHADEVVVFEVGDWDHNAHAEWCQSFTTTTTTDLQAL